MSYDLNKWVENERRTMPRRRYVPYALGVLMLSVSGFAILEVFDGGDTDVVANFGPMLLLFILALVNSPFSRDSWLGLKPGRHDEFEEAVLARATARAFALFGALVILTFIWLWLASLNGWPVPRTPLDWSALGLAFTAVGTALPVMLAEIMVPFPPAADADQEERV